MSIEKYPYYKLKTPSDKESLIKNIRKMAVYWEKLTTRSQDMSLGRLKSETISELKKHFKWYVSSEAAKIWLGWKSKGVPKKRSTKKISKKRSYKKLSKKRSTKKISKKRSMKKSIRKRHSNTSPSRERIRANRPSPSTGASSQKIGTVMKGNDGKMYKVIKTSSGTRRWVKN
jgi:glucan-binding YG repeat protein